MASRGGYPKTESRNIVWFVGRGKGRRLSEKVEGFASVFSRWVTKGWWVERDRGRRIVLRL